MESPINVLKALSDETRLRILNLLYDQELCVCFIVETLEIPQTKVSRHLAILKNAGLVSDRKYAQWVYYSVLRSGNRQFIDSLIYDNLRSMPPFQEDLSKLAKRISVICDTCNVKGK